MEHQQGKSLGRRVAGCDPGRGRGVGGVTGIGGVVVGKRRVDGRAEPRGIVVYTQGRRCDGDVRAAGALGRVGERHLGAVTHACT
jgi:hypothetical protein